MNNKLSELSKPVAWASQRHIDTRCSIEAFTDEESAKGTRWEKIAPLYSQEYVSALLAERDAFEGAALALRDELREVRAELEAKDKRIAELETGLGLKHVRAVEEALIFATDRNSELEAKLATLVRLPPLMDSELCGKYGVKYSAAANAHNNAITACSIAIRGAGFKSEATALKCVGDE